MHCQRWPLLSEVCRLAGLPLVGSKVIVRNTTFIVLNFSILGLYSECVGKIVLNFSILGLYSECVGKIGMMQQVDCVQVCVALVSGSHIGLHPALCSIL